MSLSLHSAPPPIDRRGSFADKPPGAMGQSVKAMGAKTLRRMRTEEMVTKAKNMKARPTFPELKVIEKHRREMLRRVSPPRVAREGKPRASAV